MHDTRERGDVVDARASLPINAGPISAWGPHTEPSLSIFDHCLAGIIGAVCERCSWQTAHGNVGLLNRGAPPARADKRCWSDKA